MSNGKSAGGDKPVWFITGCSTGFGRELAQHLLDAGGGLGGDSEGLGLDHALHLRRGRAGGQEQADDDEDQHGQRRDADQQGLERRTAAPTGRRRDWISGNITRGGGLGHGAITRSARCM